jgi:hypothetical protein
MQNKTSLQIIPKCMCMEIYLKLQLTNCNCMEAWILQIANCFDKATKQQNKRKWQNKKLAINSKEKIDLQSQFGWQLQLKNQDYRKFEDQNHWKLKDWKLTLQSQFVDNYSWKIMIIESLRTKIIES